MKVFPFLVLGLLYFYSCTTSKLMTSSVQPSEVTELQWIEPYSQISLIEKGNQIKYNDSLSKVSKRLIKKVSESFKENLPLTSECMVSDTVLQRKLNKEITSLFSLAIKMHNINNIKITPLIDSLLEASGKRFGLITISSGFTRVKGNFGKQVWKGAGVGLLTLGMYTQTPIKANSSLYAMIVDAKDDNIAFYKRSFLENKEPLEEDVLKKQFRDVFSGYFLAKE